MCSRATCRRCGKVTWSGCGAHVDKVMKGIPAKDRCVCDRAARVPAQGGARSGGVLGALFGRREGIR